MRKAFNLPSYTLTTLLGLANNFEKDSSLYQACFIYVLIELSLQAFVVVGDFNGHVGLGVKCAKEVRQHWLIPVQTL